MYIPDRNLHLCMLVIPCSVVGGMRRSPYIHQLLRETSHAARERWLLSFAVIARVPITSRPTMPHALTGFPRAARVRSVAVEARRALLLFGYLSVQRNLRGISKN